MRATAATDLVVGVGTHRDTHTAAVCDRAGQALAVRQFTAGPDGYAAALGWARQEAGQAGLAWAIPRLRPPTANPLAPIRLDGADWRPGWGSVAVGLT